MRPAAASFLFRLTATLAALALVLVSFAHRPALLSPDDLRDRASLVLLGLGEADLCAPSGGDDRMPAEPCPACILAKTLAPPAAPVSAARPILPARAAPVAVPLVPVTGQTCRPPPARGPPLSIA
ncbi:MAG: hypothetical protein ACK4GW_04845 [Pseudorhodobacter sp.]